MVNATKRNATRRKKSQVRPGVFSSVYFAEEDEHATVQKAAKLEGVSVNEFIVRRITKIAERIVERAKAA